MMVDTNRRQRRFTPSFGTFSARPDNAGRVLSYQFILYAMTTRYKEDNPFPLPGLLRFYVDQLLHLTEIIADEDLTILALRISSGNLEDAENVVSFIDLAHTNLIQLSLRIESIPYDLQSAEFNLDFSNHHYIDEIISKCDALFISLIQSLSRYYHCDDNSMKCLIFALSSLHDLPSSKLLSLHKDSSVYFRFSGIISLIQFIMDDENTKLYATPALIELIKSYTEFPGARALGIPFKEAVELYISIKYHEKLRDGTLTRPQIYAADKKLYRAIADYERNSPLPFTIPSVRDVARERFQYFVENGIEGASRAARHSINKMTKRLRKPTP